MWNIRSEDPDITPDVRYPEKVECRSNRDIPGWNKLCSASQGGPSACARCRDPSPWWHGARIAIRSNSIRIPQENMWRAPLSGLPQGTAHDTRKHHTPDDSISYPDMLSRSLTKASKPCYFIPKACYSPHSTALQWCVRTPCPNIFAMDSKELSSISNCFGDQKAIKTPKLNTIWLELIARVLNMLIGLKCDNYYSKVFKRVNYKLWNSTFCVVITRYC